MTLTDTELGSIIRAARTAARLSQAELGERTGFSQPVISRLERGQRRATDIDVLGRVGRELKIPPRQLGLAEQEPPVNRREFLSTAGAAAVAAALPAVAPAPDIDYATGLRTVTGTYRRMDALMPGRDLIAPVSAHLAIGRQLLERTTGSDQADVAAAVSETAGLAAWLEWDGSNVGNARSNYLLAMRTARHSGSELLRAYMTGSLASMVIANEDAAEGFVLLRQAREQLGPEPSSIADAWLSCQEAVAHATTGDAVQADLLLGRADDLVERVPSESPPWPWVFVFDHAKVAGFRISCATRLRRPGDAFAATETAALSAASHPRQQALLMLDLAEAHLVAGQPDVAFAIGAGALEVAAPFASGRVADRARALRRTATGHIAPGIMSEFDDRLRSMAN